MNWLAKQQGALLEGQDRQHHALLITGLKGTGREWLACAHAAALLGLELPETSSPEGYRPAEWLNERAADFRLVAPEEDKHWISVDQVRELTATLNLTSHGRGRKLALVNPAQNLNRNSANSLLKTLEEPPGDSVIILIAESLGQLPATVVSRCRRIRLKPPLRSAALDWLKQFDPEKDWKVLLEMAGGAPLLALELEQGDFSEWARRFQQGMGDLTAGRAGPVQIARQWTKARPEFWIRWLYWFTAGQLRAEMSSHPHQTLRPWFMQLDQLNRQSRQIGGALNWEVQLAALLAPWYGGLNRGIAK